MGAKLVFLGHCQTVRLHTAFAAHVDQPFDKCVVVLRVRLEGPDPVAIEKSGVFAKIRLRDHFGVERFFDNLILVPGINGDVAPFKRIHCPPNAPAPGKFLNFAAQGLGNNLMTKIKW